MNACLLCAPETARPYELQARVTYQGKGDMGTLQPYGLSVVGTVGWEVYAAPCCGHVIFLRMDLKA